MAGGGRADHLGGRATSRPPIVAVVGATASGKSELALDLAERLGGEIVNTDSMAVYRGMDIGTAKPTLPQRRGIPHHLLDLLEVTEPLSVAEFQTRARTAIADIRGRGATPVLVGGSALYTRAVVDRFEFPGTDPVVRRELSDELAAVGPRVLHGRLTEVDPAAADRIPPDNGRRIVRALEVVRLTGQPFRAELPALTYADPDTIQIGVDIDRPTLDARIAERVRMMFDDGLVAEVEGMLAAGLAAGPTARAAIGYREVTSYLSGELTLDEARDRTAAATRRFSRRQDGWFRKDPRVSWVHFDDPDRVERALQPIHKGE